MTELRDNLDGPADLTPSAKFVYYVLAEADRPLTTPQIAARTAIDGRTVRRALDDLRDADLVETRPPGVRNPRAPVHHPREE